MDAELTKRLGTLESAELSILLDFMQTGPMDELELVNGQLKVVNDPVDAASKRIKKS